MPDNEKNITPGPDKGDTLANLSEMISSAKKKMGQEQNQASAPQKKAPAENASKALQKPDISFAAAPVAEKAIQPKPAVEKPAVAEKAAAVADKAASAAAKTAPEAPKPAAKPVPQPAKPATEKVSAIADKVAEAADKAAKRPTQAAPAAQNGAPAAKPGQPPRRPAPPKRRPPQQGAQAKPGARPAAQNGTPTQPGSAPKPAQAAKQGTKAAKPGEKAPAQAAGKKPAQTAKKPVQNGKAVPASAQAKKPAAKKEPVAPAADKPDIKFGSNTPGKPETEEKKSRFTKKQVATIAGLVVGLLFLLVLVVILILVYYLGLFDRTGKKISNSEAPTYSDVDFSRPDTMDTVTADEKLKELRGKAEMISNKDVMNILLIGEDLRDTATEDAGNTDVMMIISVNKKDKTITETSIMRDCYVYFPDYGYSNRINAAYWHGGIELTQKTIEDYLGLKIDRYVLVNFKVFIDIVDTLGGLDLTVTDEEANGEPGADPHGDNTRGMQNPLDEQNKYLGNKKGTDYIKKGGDLHLNGNQALAYARLRHVGNSDYERTARQRKVIKEMIKKSKKLSIIEMDKLANKIFPQIKTDVTEGEMAQLLIEMLDYRNYKVQEFRVPMDDTYTNQVINGMDVLDVDFWTNSEMLKKKVYGSLAEEDEAAETEKTIE
ncbi:MAG: LCP family protein [Ruminococcus sp.]|nr:LCP family protein [Ruminococcus sp.]